MNDETILEGAENTGLMRNIEWRILSREEQDPGCSMHVCEKGIRMMEEMLTDPHYGGAYRKKEEWFRQKNRRASGQGV